MGAIWGNKLKLSIFGESHGVGVGINIDGIPSGIRLNFDEIKKFLERRAPGRDEFSTSRKESDNFEILSGILDNVTTGAPVCILIRNNNIISKDYSELKEIMRPNHSDYPAHIKYSGYNDIRGGGHFSGRLTAPLVFTGAIAREILKQKNIEIGARIKRIGKIEDKKEILCLNELKKLQTKKLAVLDDGILELMTKEIEIAKKNGNSIGGIIETFAFNLPVGLGEPFFDSVESTISHLAFSVPSVKGIEFGKGFEFGESFGSDVTDEYYYDGDIIKTKMNNNGGVLGGLTTGMPLNFRVVIKPTPSISKTQKTINVKEKHECQLNIKGRHDACIVPRVVVVIEAITAIALLDYILQEGK